MKPRHVIRTTKCVFKRAYSKRATQGYDSHELIPGGRSFHEWDKKDSVEYRARAHGLNDAPATHPAEMSGGYDRKGFLLTRF